MNGLRNLSISKQQDPTDLGIVWKRDIYSTIPISFIRDPEGFASTKYDCASCERSTQNRAQDWTGQRDLRYYGWGPAGLRKGWDQCHRVTCINYPESSSQGEGEEEEDEEGTWITKDRVRSTVLLDCVRSTVQ